MDIYVVPVNNGDTEPEFWAFAEEQDAEQFAEARTGIVGYPPHAIALHDKESAAKLIAEECSR